MATIPTEIVAVVVSLAIPAAAGAVAWICRSGSIAQAHEKSKADREEVQRIHDCLDRHSAGLNWIGSAVEELAHHQQVSLPPRPIVPERERE
jgi:hypothetical protein